MGLLQTALLSCPCNAVFAKPSRKRIRWQKISEKATVMVDIRLGYCLR